METDTDIEYAFSELSETAKQNARDKYKFSGYPHHDWWNNVYEDANQIAKILGLDIESPKVSRTGRNYTNIDISFSGFWSQGDGACFKGYYRFNPEAVNKINEYCNDEELIRIATELTVMQTTQRLKGCEFFSATICQSGSYSHSNTMTFDIHDFATDEVGEVDENQFGQLMCDFADWIYKTLEAQHDYLTSDEVVDERLAEEKFDVDGVCL